MKLHVTQEIVAALQEVFGLVLQHVTNQIHDTSAMAGSLHLVPKINPLREEKNQSEEKTSEQA